MSESTGQALFVAIRIDQNADPNANDIATVYLDPIPAKVPEPATWSFMAGSLAIFAVAVRRRAARV